MHIKYSKISALHKEECEGILDGDVYIQEKIDGANLSVRYDGGLCIGSRTQVIYSNGECHKTFRGAQDYILNHKGIIELLDKNRNYRLYGERLVKHTIIYPEEHYNKFYMFDIMDGDRFLDISEVYDIANRYGIETPSLLYYGKTDIDHINTIVGKSSLGVVGEGVVIKNMSFVNKFLDNQYAKVVRKEFKEANSIVFGNYNKGDIEIEFAVKFINEARVLKVINKIEQNEDKKIDISDTPKVMGLCYHDAFSEELWSFSKNRCIDFKELNKQCNNRCRFLFHEWLNNANSNSNEMT